MSAWKQDSLATLVASALLTVGLFFAQQYLDYRDGVTVPAPRAESTETSSRFPDPEPTRTAQNTPRTPQDIAANTWKVVAVIDGDTADILVDGQPKRLRFAGIDCPEKGQPFGNAAKKALADRIGGKSIQVEVRDTDRYGRSIADLYDERGHINLWLVQQGLAWHYRAFSDSPQLDAAEASAQQNRRGLWSDPRRVEPWNWRKLSKVERDRYR